MRSLLTVCAGLVVALGIVSGFLWRELRAERLLASEQQSRMPQGTLSDVVSPRPQASQTTVEDSTTPVASAKVPDPMPLSLADRHEHQHVPESPPVPVSSAAATRLEEIRRAEVLQLAEQAGTGRTLAWRDRLAIAGHTLTAAQLQALNAAAIRENRRLAEESFDRAATAIPPRDDEDVFRASEDELNRLNETNLRILQSVRSQLTEEQEKALRAQFDNGHATRLEALRVERERAALIREAQAAQRLSIPSSR